MIDKLRTALQAELVAASTAMAARDIEGAFAHLCRAHIISQRHTRPHVHVHWLMLKAGLHARDWREVLGQLSRMFAAGIFSQIWVPAGNTGRADVSALKPMPLPDDLRVLLAEDRIQRCRGAGPDE